MRLRGISCTKTTVLIQEYILVMYALNNFRVRQFKKNARHSPNGFTLHRTIYISCIVLWPNVPTFTIYIFKHYISCLNWNRRYLYARTKFRSFTIRSHFYCIFMAIFSASFFIFERISTSGTFTMFPVVIIYFWLLKMFWDI